MNIAGFPTSDTPQVIRAFCFPPLIAGQTMRIGSSNTRNSSPGSTPRARGQACERCWKRKQKVCQESTRRGTVARRHKGTPVISTQVPKADGTQCDRKLPECTACVGVGVRCVPRKFPVDPITKNGGNLSHAAVPRSVSSLTWEIIHCHNR